MKRNLFMRLSVVAALACAVLMVLFVIALRTIPDVRAMVFACILLGVPAMTLLALSVIMHYVVQE